MTHLSKHNLDEEVKKVYSYRRDDETDLQTIEHKGGGSGWKKLAILFFAAGFLLSLIWGGYILLGRGPASGDDIKITINGPKEIEAMKEYDFTATLEDVGALDLSRVSFELDTPDQFFLLSSDQLLDPRHMMTIGNLAKGEKRTVAFRGVFVAKEKDAVALNVVATYHPQNFNATFEANGAWNGTMTEGVFSGSVDGPDKLLSGDEGTFTISYAKKDLADIPDLAVSLDAPADFIVTTSTVQPTRDKIWPIAFAANSKEGQAVFKGTFSADASGDRVIKFLLGQVRDTKFFPTKEMDVPVEVLGSDLGINVSLNGTAIGNLSNPAFMNFGDLLSYAIDVSSMNKEILKNVRVIFHAVGEPQVNGETVVMWPTANQSPNGNYADNSITWTGNEVPSFKNFKSGSGEHLEGSVRLRPGPFPIPFADYRIRVWVEVQLDGVGKINKKRALLSKIATIAIQSDTAFQSEARYYGANGEALSTGPLPPQVGKETTYRIFWRVSNSLHQLNNLAISAPLGANVVLTGKNLIPSGVFSFDTAGKMATWSLDSWPSDAKNMEINFEVELTPHSSDVGTMPMLVGPAAFKARDATTGADINLAVPALTTNITNDSFAGGKSTVVP